MISVLTRILSLGVLLSVCAASLYASELPLSLADGTPLLLVILILAAGTFISEDLTCIGAGILVAEGSLALGTALAGCFLGIWLGDIGLWYLGRIGRRGAVRFSFIQAIIERPAVASAMESLRTRGGGLIWLSRFTPGMRLPLYVAAGISGMSAQRFAGLTFLAVGIWTPCL